MLVSTSDCHHGRTQGPNTQGIDGFVLRVHKVHSLSHLYLYSYMSLSMHTLTDSHALFPFSMDTMDM